MVQLQTRMPDLSAFNPFDLDNDVAYRIWRDWKQEHAATRVEHLLVEIRNPLHLTPAEHLAILTRCAHNNMALYQCDTDLPQDKHIPQAIGRQFGLEQLDHNWLADADAVTSLTVNPEANHRQFIPYTNRPIQWHTDGYYNAPDRQIRGLILHCADPAVQGGENALLDPELAYIHLRDRDPAFINALMHPGAMTIPARTDEDGVARPAQTGPVFSVDPATGTLHMRFTARTRSIEWHPALPALQEAREALMELLEGNSPYLVQGRLERGMGLISNNVLHNRSGFDDREGQPPRLLFRARYYDRILGTNLAEMFNGGIPGGPGSGF